MSLDSDLAGQDIMRRSHRDGNKLFDMTNSFKERADDEDEYNLKTVDSAIQKN